MRVFIPHLVSDGSAKHEHPYCCECDYCHTDGIKCEGPAFVLEVAPEQNAYVLCCSNHIANGVWAMHRYLAAHPGSHVAHNVYESDYEAGHMPDGTGWVDS